MKRWGLQLMAILPSPDFARARRLSLSKGGRIIVNIAKKSVLILKETMLRNKDVFFPIFLCFLSLLNRVFLGLLSYIGFHIYIFFKEF